MTRLFLLTILVALSAPATASAATYIYDVPDLVARPLAAVKKATSIDVLLPSQFTSDLPKLYSEGRGRGGAYRFEIGAVRHCRGANACFIASFRAKRGGKPGNPRKVHLKRGHRGYFQPLRCGASCAPPSLEWVQDGVLYTIEGKLGTKKSERRVLTRLANSAIGKGAR
ncbi:MAG: hypothetical protein ABI611_14855 [Solirubrobacteraceae bacterium]